MPPNNQAPQQPLPPPAAPADVPQPQAMPAAPQAIGSQGVQPPQPTGSQPAQSTQSLQPAAPSNPSSTQNTLLFSEIRDNMVIMSDGSFRAVVACKSINFDLMSSREREGIEYSYQNFLNSLNYPVQILVRSQRVDIGPYIDKLVQLRRDQDNMLLNVLMDDYINFIDILSEEANIMDKSFFITVPYFPAGDLNALKDQAKGFFGKLFTKAAPVTKIDNNTYEKAKDEIKNRVDNVMSGLFQIGVQSVQLTTKELGELYYNFYNPDTAVREPLGDFEKTASIYVKKGQTQPETPAAQPGGIQ